MRFALKEVTGKAAGKVIDVATAAVRSCVTLLSSEERSERMPCYIVVSQMQRTHLRDTPSEEQ